MIHNVKVAGLVLAAALSISALMPSAASAQQGLITSDGPVTLRLDGTGGELKERLTLLGEVGCPGTIYTGHEYGATPHEMIPSGATTITITPHYHQIHCEALNGFFRVTIDMNGCDYVLHLGETSIGKVDTYEVTTDIVCPAEKSMTITFFGKEPQHTESSSPLCIVHVKPQMNLQGAKATDTTNGHIGIEGTIEGIHAERTSKSIFCSTTTTTNGKIDLDLTVAGYTEAGEPTSLAISD